MYVDLVAMPDVIPAAMLTSVQLAVVCLFSSQPDTPYLAAYHHLYSYLNSFRGAELNHPAPLKATRLVLWQALGTTRPQP